MGPCECNRPVGGDHGELESTFPSRESTHYSALEHCCHIERNENMIKSMESGPSLGSNPSSFTSCFTSLCLEFSICKMRILLVTTS